MNAADINSIKYLLIAIICFIFSSEALLWGIKKELQDIFWTLQQIKRKIETENE